MNKGNSQATLYCAESKNVVDKDTLFLCAHAVLLVHCGLSIERPFVLFGIG